MRRAAASCSPGLTLLGAMFGMVDVTHLLTPAERSAPVPGRPQNEPPPNHPERLLPHSTLSADERELWAQLEGLGQD
ncbi:DUF6059 family protein [Streptomyces sp. NPDC047042]|uniref:DUF6059 family protein n=1 Tax=Streptomyces sp. NPDC047042 TaxID=3154807 RepID=UPI0033CA9A92